MTKPGCIFERHLLLLMLSILNVKTMSSGKLAFSGLNALLQRQMYITALFVLFLIHGMLSLYISGVKFILSGGHTWPNLICRGPECGKKQYQSINQPRTKG